MMPFNIGFISQAGESDWVYVLESVDAFNKFLVGAGLDDLGEKDDTRLRTLIHGQRNGYWRLHPKDSNLMSQQIKS